MEKALDKIYEEMLAVFGEASGYVPSKSCDLAARLYAAAAQIQGLYLQAQWLLDQSFPQTAAGEYLDRHAQLRGIRRSVATCAEGVLRFGVSRAARLPLEINATRSHSRSASVILWVVTKTVVPFFRSCSMIFLNKTAPEGSKPLVGSSRNNKRGLPIRARAILTL